MCVGSRGGKWWATSALVNQRPGRSRVSLLPSVIPKRRIQNSRSLFGYQLMMTAARGLPRLATQCGGRHVVTDDVTTAWLKSPTPTQPRAIAALLHEKDMGRTAPDFVCLGPAYKSAVMLAPKKTHHRLNETMQTSAGLYSVKVMPIHKILRRSSEARRRRSEACNARVLPRPVMHRPASTPTRSASR